MSTRKMRTAAIIMILLLVLAVGGYVLVDQSKRREELAEEAEQASLQLFDFSSDAVEAVLLETDDGNFRVENQNGEWVLTETDYAYGLELDGYYINSVCSGMSQLTALRKFSADSDKEAFGLTNPVTVTCYVGGTPHTLYVGGPSATEDYYYVMVPEDDTIYGIAYATGEVLHAETDRLRKSELIPFHETEVDYFRLVPKEGMTIELEKKDGLWHMTEPLAGANINSATVNTMLRTLTRVEADGFVTADKNADLSAYGLNKPEYTFQVGAGDDMCLLQFSADAEDSEMMYVLNEATGLVSHITTMHANFIHLQPEELMNTNLLNIHFEETAELDVMIDRMRYFILTLDHENGSYYFNDTDIVPLGDNAVSTYKNLFATVANISYESMDLDAEIPEDAEADCGFAFTLIDGTKTVLTLVASDEENIYWALIDGQYTGMTVRRREITGNTGIKSFYERMKDIVDNQ